MIVHLILAGLALLFAWVLLVLASPVHRCPRCHGKRVTMSRISRRRIGCPRCKVTGRTYRRGAVLLHRLRWSITAELRDLAAERRERKQVN